MAVVDLYRAYRFEYNSEFQNMTILQFADILCSGLVERKRIVHPKAIRDKCNKGRLKRIVDRNGNETKQVTKKQKRGKHMRIKCGSAVQRSCWICRLHGKEKTSYTSFCCAICNTPLCCGTKPNGYSSVFNSCIEEHLRSSNSLVQCNRTTKRNFTTNYKRQLEDRT